MVARAERAAAKAAGLIQYFTGKPCINGHIGPRNTAGGYCLQCINELRQCKRAKKKGYRTRAEIAADTNKPMRRCKACKKEFPATSEFFVTLRKIQPSGTVTLGFARECRDCRNKRFTTFYADNREAMILRVTEYTRDNPAPKRNRDAIRYMRRKKRNGCPPWADQKKLETIYAIADYLTKKTGIPHEVDHYYPLMHKKCCGLHVPWNLRVITQAANQAKGNRLPE
jgi:hypothetical protein